MRSPRSAPPPQLRISLETSFRPPAMGYDSTQKFYPRRKIYRLALTQRQRPAPVSERSSRISRPRVTRARLPRMNLLPTILISTWFVARVGTTSITQTPRIHTSGGPSHELGKQAAYVIMPMRVYVSKRGRGEARVWSKLVEGVVSSETAFVGAFVGTDAALRCSFLKGPAVR